MNVRDAYRLLEIGPDAPDEEVRRAWRDLTKVWHPDRFAHDAELQRKAEEKLKEVNAAYETIVEARAGRGWRDDRPAGGEPRGEERTAPPWTVRSGGREWPAPDLRTILIWAAGGRIDADAEVRDPSGGAWMRLDSMPEGREALARASARRARGWGVVCLAVAVVFLLRRPSLGGFILAAAFFLVGMIFFTRGR